MATETVAVLEGFFSRPMAPTRRLSLGRQQLPTGTDAVFTRVLLGGVVAHAAAHLDDETLEQFGQLLESLAAGDRIAQPRLRHRLQDDKVGLRRCRHRLVRTDDVIGYAIAEDRGTPTQHLLCAAYAAAAQPLHERPALLTALSKGASWTGDVDSQLIAHLADRRNVSAAIAADPVAWALGVLDMSDGVIEARRAEDDVRAAFRAGQRAAHPDPGAAASDAAQRIAELREARDILLRA